MWGTGDGRSSLTVIARSSPKVQMPDVLPDEPGQSIPTNFGTQLVTRVPSVKKIWLTVGPCDPSFSPEERHIKLLMPVVTQFTQAALEVEHAATELAERYEEINLLYTIGEILGRTVTLEDAAATILTEISETVGARVASILVLVTGGAAQRRYLRPVLWTPILLLAIGVIVVTESRTALLALLLAAILPVRSMPNSYKTRVPGRRSVAKPSTSRETWKKMSRPPSSGRRKPKPLVSK